MYKIILTGLFFGFISCLHGQELVIKEKAHGNGNVKEKYEVLKSDPTIKHGKYESYYFNGKIKENGVYVDNQKDGEWREAYNNGTIVEFQYFEQGKKVGVWEKHHKNHQVIELYDHDNEKQLETIIRNVRPKYPFEARELGIEGIVKVNLSLNSDCSVKAINLVQGVGYGCDEASIETVKKIAFLKKEHNPNGCEAKNEIIEFKFSLD